MNQLQQQQCLGTSGESLQMEAGHATQSQKKNDYGERLNSSEEAHIHQKQYITYTIVLGS